MNGIIWYVEFTDLSCAWTKKEDAISYFYNECKRLGATPELEEGDEKDDDSYLIYHITYDNKEFEDEVIFIIPVFLNQKPYRK